MEDLAQVSAAKEVAESLGRKRIKHFLDHHYPYWERSKVWKLWNIDSKVSYKALLAPWFAPHRPIGRFVINVAFLDGPKQAR